MARETKITIPAYIGSSEPDNCEVFKETQLSFVKFDEADDLSIIHGKTEYSIKRSELEKIFEFLFDDVKTNVPEKEQASRPQQEAPTHYHVADNSNGFRAWLDENKIPFIPNGHFTSIPLNGNDIFRLGVDFALWREQQPSYKYKQQQEAGKEEGERLFTMEEMKKAVEFGAEHEDYLTDSYGCFSVTRFNKDEEGRVKRFFQSLQNVKQ